MPRTFLDLPAEVRLKIYRHVFVGSRFSVLVKRVEQGTSVKRNLDCAATLHFDLLMTCQRINEEAFDIMASSMELHIHYDSNWWVQYDMYDDDWHHDLDLSQLVFHPDLPRLVSRAIPFIQKMRYAGYHQGRWFGSGLQLFPSLRTLYIESCGVASVLPDSPYRYHDFQEERSPDQRAAAAADQYRTTDDIPGFAHLATLLHTTGKCFKVALRMLTCFDSPSCQSRSGDCLIRSLSHTESLLLYYVCVAVYSPDKCLLTYSTQRFDIELEADQSDITNKKLILQEKTFDTYEALREEIHHRRIW